MMRGLKEHPAFGERGLGSYVLTSFALGVFLGVGIILGFLSETSWELGFFLASLALFHFSEFFFVVFYHPTTLSWDSFMLNHSSAYVAAMAAAFSEYWLERWLLPGLKGHRALILIGLLMTVVGQVIRIVALFTAKKAFTHEVAETKREEHKLVTIGIYKYIRHPGYMGWFWWTIGTQVMLLNPICVPAFAYASWSFFSERIQDEEAKLVRFFPEYPQYRSRTPTLIPMIP